VASWRINVLKDFALSSVEFWINTLLSKGRFDVWDEMSSVLKLPNCPKDVVQVVDNIRKRHELDKKDFLSHVYRDHPLGFDPFPLGFDPFDRRRFIRKWRKSQV